MYDNLQVDRGPGFDAYLRSVVYEKVAKLLILLVNTKETVTPSRHVGNICGIHCFLYIKCTSVSYNS